MFYLLNKPSLLTGFEQLTEKIRWRARSLLYSNTVSLGYSRKDFEFDRQREAFERLSVIYNKQDFKGLINISSNGVLPKGIHFPRIWQSVNSTWNLNSRKCQLLTLQCSTKLSHMILRGPVTIFSRYKFYDNRGLHESKFNNFY